MAVNDYKQMTFKLTREDEFISEKDNLVEAFKSYLKRLAKGDKNLKLVVGVNLKRRQNLESYKKQVAKALEAHRVEFITTAKKLGITLAENFDEYIGTAMLVSARMDNTFTVEDCSHNFLLVCSEIKITE